MRIIHYETKTYTNVLWNRAGQAQKACVRKRVGVTGLGKREIRYMGNRNGSWGPAVPGEPAGRV